MERVQGHRETGDGICPEYDRLRRTELVLKRRLDVGVHQELYPRSNPVSRYTGRPIEGRTAESARRQAVHVVRVGVYGVITHQHHHPRISEPFDVGEASAKCSRPAGNETDG